jgi:hypothetical protein
MIDYICRIGVSPSEEVNADIYIYIYIYIYIGINKNKQTKNLSKLTLDVCGFGRFRSGR